MNIRRQGRWAPTAAIACAAIITVAGCSTGGESTGIAQQATSTPAVTSTGPSTTTSVSTSPSTSASVSPSAKLPEIMPDFVGGTVDQAEAVLKPLNVRIKKQNQISAEPAGTIVEQDPVAGADFAQSVTLTVSIAPPVVPDVTQKTFGNAQETLADLGFEVKENPVFDEKLADGLVVEQDPPAGATNASEVTLNVVRRPVVAYLSDMEAVSQAGVSGPQPGVQKANGKAYSHGVAVTPYNNAVGTVEYDLSRQYRRLVGELALDDKSPSAAVAKVEIYGDGRLLTEPDIAFGKTTSVDVDVTDVLRLRIAFSETDGNGQAPIILGDFKAQGVQSEVVSTTGTDTSTTATTTTSR